MITKAVYFTPQAKTKESNTVQLLPSTIFIQFVLKQHRTFTWFKVVNRFRDAFHLPHYPVRSVGMTNRTNRTTHPSRKFPGQTDYL